MNLSGIYPYDLVVNLIRERIDPEYEGNPELRGKWWVHVGYDGFGNAQYLWKNGTVHDTCPVHDTCQWFDSGGEASVAYQNWLARN